MSDPFPVMRSPMLATLIDAPFDDDDWLFETKWDGFRALCTISAGGTMELRSRNGKNLLVKFPRLDTLRSSFRGTSLLLDGEIVALDRYGRSNFQRLQEAEYRDFPLSYAVFDLLYARGHDLRERPLLERKERLREVLRSDGRAVYSEYVIGTGRSCFSRAKRRHLEGIVGKRSASTYQERRSRDWVKIKATLEQEFVVAGWSEPQGSRVGFGSLLLGAYEGSTLRYVGEVGTGFSVARLREIHGMLRKRVRATAPFGEIPPGTNGVHWVSPTVVVEVRFTEWTRDHRLRHPVFIGLRDDKPAREVTFEFPVRWTT